MFWIQKKENHTCHRQIVLKYSIDYYINLFQINWLKQKRTIFLKALDDQCLNCFLILQQKSLNEIALIGNYFNKAAIIFTFW